MEGLNKNKDTQEKPNLESSKVIEVGKNTNEVSKEEKSEIISQRKEEDKDKIENLRNELMSGNETNDKEKLKERLTEINKFFDEKNKKFNGEPYIANAETNRLFKERDEIEAKLNS